MTANKVCFACLICHNCGGLQPLIAITIFTPECNENILFYEPDNMSGQNSYYFDIYMLVKVS